MSQTVALVTCAQRKQAQRKPPGKLFGSDYFNAVAAYAQKHTDRWFILSPRYGLLAPDMVIDPYEQQLRDLPAAQRRAWGEQVVRELKRMLKPGDKVIILARMSDCATLIQPLKDLGCEVSTPLEGLTQGKQLGWLKNQLL